MRFCLKEALQAVDELCNEFEIRSLVPPKKDLEKMTNVQLISNFRSSIHLLKAQSSNRPPHQEQSVSRKSSPEMSLDDESRERQLYIDELES